MKKAEVMRKVRTKMVGESLEIPRALTIMYGKNPDRTLFQNQVYNPDFENMKQLKQKIDSTMHLLVLEEIYFKKLVQILEQFSGQYKKIDESKSK